MNFKKLFLLSLTLLFLIPSLSHAMWRRWFTRGCKIAQAGIATSSTSQLLWILYRVRKLEKETPLISPTPEQKDFIHETLKKRNVDLKNITLLPSNEYAATLESSLKYEDTTLHGLLVFQEYYQKALARCRSNQKRSWILIKLFGDPYQKFIKECEEELQSIEEKLDAHRFILHHEASHLEHEHSKQKVQFQLAFPPSLYLTMQVTHAMIKKLRRIPITTPSTIRSLCRLPIGGAQLGLATICFYLFCKHQEYVADIDAARAINNPNIIKAGAENYKEDTYPIYQQYALNELEKIGIPFLIKWFKGERIFHRMVHEFWIDPQHPFILTRARYLKAYANKLVLRQAQGERSEK